MQLSTQKRSTTPFAILLLTLIGISTSGCGGSKEQVVAYDDFFAQLVTQLDAITAEFKTMKDGPSASLAADRIVGLCNALTRHISTSSDLPKPGTGAGLQIKKSYEEEWEKKLKRAVSRLEKASDNAQSRVGRHPSLRRVEVQLTSIKTQLEAFEQGYREALGVE